MVVREELVGAVLIQVEHLAPERRPQVAFRLLRNGMNAPAPMAATVARLPRAMYALSQFDRREFRAARGRGESVCRRFGGFGTQCFYRHFSAKVHDQISRNYLKLHALVGTAAQRSRRR